jgi:hypothetical protein
MTGRGSYNAAPHTTQETEHMSDKKQASRLPGDKVGFPDSSEQPKWEAPPERVTDETPSEEERVRDAAQIKGNDVLYRLYREGKLSQPPPEFTADNGQTDLTEKFNLALQGYKVERDDNLPLQFTGYLVGWNDVDLSVPRGTRVTIFVTRSNKIVTAVHQWQRGEKKHRQRHAAGVHESPESALEWLIEDGQGRLGRSSREAWEAACQVWPSLRGRDVEVID